MKKVLISTNLENKRFGLKRKAIKDYSPLTGIIFNFRKYFHNLGYDSSLLRDDEILAFEELIHDAEHGDPEQLREVLEFLVDPSMETVNYKSMKKDAERYRYLCNDCPDLVIFDFLADAKSDNQLGKFDEIVDSKIAEAGEKK